jgi:hypothetical protein
VIFLIGAGTSWRGWRLLPPWPKNRPIKEINPMTPNEFVVCQHCGGQIVNDGRLDDQAVACRHCKEPTQIPDPAQVIGFDTAGRKAKIIGSWKVFGDVAPPCVPESALSRDIGAAIDVSRAKATPTPTGNTNAGVQPTSKAARTVPPPFLSACPTVATRGLRVAIDVV